MSARLLLVVITLVGHAPTLFDGLFLDDHLHQREMQRSGWSISELLSVTSIETNEFLSCWWQENPTRWQYARPLSVALMKGVQAVSGGNLIAQHVTSIVIHLLLVMLVHAFLLRATARPGWSIYGAAMFALYTHTFIPVAWLAAQNAVLQTLLTFAAWLLYLQASRLDVSPDGALPQDSSLRQGAYWGVVGLMALSLMCRENAVVLPLMTIAADVAYAGWRHAWRRRYAHGLLLVMAGAFSLWRLLAYYAPVPDFYLRPYDGPGYLLWCLAKLMHYLTSTVWLTPMSVGPTGRYAPFIEVPYDCIMMATILIAMNAGYYCACRRVRGWWLWPLWMFLSVAPVTPVMATPHTGYMAGIGFAIAMALAPAMRDRARPISIGKWSPIVAGWFLFATLVYVPLTRTVWISLQAAEDFTIHRMTALPEPPPGAKDVFFINLPFVNIYAPIHLNETWHEDVDARQYHALTFAPELLWMRQPCVVEQLDDHRFTVAVQEKAYFSGGLGRFLIEAMRHDKRRMLTGTIVAKPLFTAEVIDSREDGIYKLLFEFRKPLNDPSMCFYLTTSECPAVKLEFRTADENTQAAAPVTTDEAVRELFARADRGDAAAGLALLETASRASGDVQQFAQALMLPVVEKLTAAKASPLRISQHMAVDREPSDPRLAEIDWQQMTEWWKVEVNDELVQAAWVNRDMLPVLERRRFWVEDTRDLLRRFVQADLYMTGPPFPGPRSP